MESDFFTEEGINFSHEDVVILVNSIVPGLIKEGFDYDEILGYYNSITWRTKAIRYLINKRAFNYEKLL